MLCQNCQKRAANVHFTQEINGNKVELYLCEKCANENGKVSFGYPFNVSDFFSGLIGIGNASPYMTPFQPQEVCEKCGMTYEDFTKTGKLGCSECYGTYGERLEPLFKRIHGNPVHTGKVPGRISSKMKTTREIDKLKELLNKAIQNEEYEKAAGLRDQIKKIEAGMQI